MVGEQNPDTFVLARLLEAILSAAGRESESAIQGRANLEWYAYQEYRDILIETNDIELHERDFSDALVPRITSQGLATLGDLRRIVARYGKENVRVETIRRQASAERRQRRGKHRTAPSPAMDSGEDSS